MPRPESRTPTALRDYFNTTAPVVACPSPHAEQVFRLSPREVACTRVGHIPRLEEAERVGGELGEALARLAFHYEHRTFIPSDFLWTARFLDPQRDPLSLLRARRGRLLVASLAEHRLINVTLFADPLPDDPGRLRLMWLQDRLVELSEAEQR